MTWFSMALAASLFDSLRDLSGKRGVTVASSPTVAFIQRITISIIFLPFLFLHYPSHLPHAFIGILALGVCINITSTLLYLESVRESDLSLAAPIMAFSPVIVSILSITLLGDTISSIGFIGIFISVLGLLSLNTNEHSSVTATLANIKSNRAARCFLLAATLNGLGSIVDKLAVSQVPPIFYLALFNTTLCFAYIPILRQTPQDLARTLQSHYLPLLLVGIFGAIGLGFYISAVSSGPIAYIGCLKRTSALWSVLLSSIILKENRILSRIKSCGWILLGNLLLILA